MDTEWYGHRRNEWLIDCTQIIIKFYRKAAAKIDQFLFARLHPSVTEMFFYKIAMLLTVVIQIPLYYYCQDKGHGKMIMCENPGCQYVWFHYDCVGIHCAHRGSWYCSDCIDE